jgi:hypothetical protein
VDVIHPRARRSFPRHARKREGMKNRCRGWGRQLSPFNGVIDINKRIHVIERLLLEHGKVLDEIFRLHGQKQRHGAKAKLVLLK